jgi:transcriptional antiterminator RfaH
MPILLAERDLLPDNLFAAPPREDDRVWWLAHTKPRQEKALARQLAASDLSFYLPCTAHRVRARGRVRTSRLPLFPGYLFVRVSEADRGRVFAGNRVARLTPVADQDRLWADLRQVRQLLDLGQPVTPEDRLEPGTIVTVRTGPLAGMTGTVLRAASGYKFVVRVDLIQRGVSVVVDGATLGKRG